MYRNHLQALAACCKDEASFEKAKQIFESVQVKRRRVERRRSEKALRQSEARHRALLDAMPDLMFRIHRDGTYLDFKADCHTDLLVPPEEMLGKKIADILPPDIAALSANKIEEALRSGKVQILEYHLPELGDYEARIVASGQDEVVAIVRDITERKLSEAALQQTTDEMQAIFQAFPDLQFRLDAAGRVLDYHAGVDTQLYVPPSEFLGKPLASFLPSSVADLAVATLEKVLSTQIPGNFEYPLPDRDGTQHIYEARMVPLREQEAIAIVRDVTERRRTESALRKSEEKFAKAFRSSPEAIAITTLPDGKIVEVNDSFLETTGFDRAELIGRTTAELKLWVNPEDREQVLRAIADQSFIRNAEFEFRRKSGEIACGLFSAELIEFDGRPCLLSVTNDITERKRSEDRARLLGEVALRIRRSLNLDQILHTTVQEVRQLLQTDRVFVALPDAGARGRIAAESVDLRYPSILGWVADEQRIQELEETFQHRGALVIDDTSLVESSAERCAFLRAYQVRAALVVPILLGDRIFGALAAHHCSSPRHWSSSEVNLLERLATQVAIAIQQAQLYQQVQELNANLERQVWERTLQLEQKIKELQELSDLKDFFLNAVSHDLRTPVMGMLLVLKNLLERGCPQADPATTIAVPRKVLERMILSSDRQLGMLNHLLDSQALEMNALVLQREPFDLWELVESSLGDLEPLFVKNQSQISITVPQMLPQVVGDRSLIHRVLENLVTNALKHNPPGLHISVSAGALDSHPWLLCSVRDDGVGLEDGDRLFERYARGKHARYSSGIGLGLYLCRQIIHAHGGEIGVESKPGEGATFWFTLPTSLEVAPQQTPTALSLPIFRESGASRDV